MRAVLHLLYKHRSEVREKLEVVESLKTELNEDKTIRVGWGKVCCWNDEYQVCVCVCVYMCMCICVCVCVCVCVSVCVSGMSCLASSWCSTDRVSPETCDTVHFNG